MNVEKELYIFCERYIQEHCKNKDIAFIKDFYNFIKDHFIRLHKQLVILEDLYFCQGKKYGDVDVFVEIYFHEEVEKKFIQLLQSKVTLDSFIGFFHFVRPELNLIL